MFKEQKKGQCLRSIVDEEESGPVSWKTIFPRAEGGVGRGGVMVQAVMRVMGSGR